VLPTWLLAWATTLELLVVPLVPPLGRRALMFLPLSEPARLVLLESGWVAPNLARETTLRHFASPM
jgi:hypothetical protein